MPAKERLQSSSFGIKIIDLFSFFNMLLRTFCLRILTGIHGKVYYGLLLPQNTKIAVLCSPTHHNSLNEINQNECRMIQQKRINVSRFHEAMIDLHK